MRAMKWALAGVAASMLGGVALAQDEAAEAEAAEAPAAEEAMPKFSKASRMGDLLDNEEAVAVFAEHVPDVPITDYRDMIADMTLEELAQIPDAYMIAEKLDEIDADLQEIE